MIISVHIPKTAGRSFRALLKAHFDNHYRDDYDNPLDKSDEIKVKQAEWFHIKYTFLKKHYHKFKNIQCIHGHFLPIKYKTYLNNNNNIFVTWLRDPIDRVVSHYFHRKKAFDNTLNTTSNGKNEQEFESFESFCFSNTMQNVYSKYLHQFPLSNFDFIGIVEHFDEDFIYFTKHFLNGNVDTIPQKNINKKKYNLSELDDKSFVEKLKQFNAKDYEIYNWALKLRENRPLKE